MPQKNQFPPREPARSFVYYSKFNRQDILKGTINDGNEIVLTALGLEYLSFCMKMNLALDKTARALFMNQDTLRALRKRDRLANAIILDHKTKAAQAAERKMDGMTAPHFKYLANSRWKDVLDKESPTEQKVIVNPEQQRLEQEGLDIIKGPLSNRDS